MGSKHPEEPSPNYQKLNSKAWALNPLKRDKYSK